MKPEPLTAEQQRLAERFATLAAKIAEQHIRERAVGRGVLADEIRSAVGLGLVMIARRFDASRGNDRLAERYFSFRIGRAIIDYAHRKHGQWGDTRKTRGMNLPAVGGLPDEIEEIGSYSRTVVRCELSIDRPMEAHNLGTAARAIGCERRELMDVLCDCKPLPAGVIVTKADGAKRRRWVIPLSSIERLMCLVLVARQRSMRRAIDRVERLESRMKTVGIECGDLVAI